MKKSNLFTKLLISLFCILFMTLILCLFKTSTSNLKSLSTDVSTVSYSFGPSQFNMIVSFVSLVSFCVLGLILTIFYYVLIQKNNHVENKTFLLQSHYQLLETKYTTIQTVNHDIKNHLICLHGLAVAENSQKVIAYIESLQQDILRSTHTILTGNKVLDIILNDKLHLITNYGISFSPTIERLDLSFITAQDLVTIVSNLLDNAIESAKKSEAKSIILKLYAFNQQTIVIKLINSCDISPKSSRKFLLTTKDNALIHGHGVKNIYKTVEKYNGHTSWSYDSSSKTFHMTLLLQRKYTPPS